MKTEKDLPKYIKEWFQYDPETGIFTYSTGEQVGTLDKKGYRCIYIKRGLVVKAHRLAWFFHYGKFPDSILDHINGIKDDNRIANLREVNTSQNMQNQRKAKSNAPTEYIGVGKGRAGKWRSQITVNGKQTYLGSFDTPEEAHKAYITAKEKIHATM